MSFKAVPQQSQVPQPLHKPLISNHGSLVTDDEIKPPKQYSFYLGTVAIIRTGPLNLLLLATPIALLSYWFDWNDAVTFIFALLAIAPFAERLGFCTEQLAIHTNDSIGGLLNATFGNATELIVAVSALTKNLFRLVQLSLLGSILSNLLLVLGCAFFFGGMWHKTQKFSKISSQLNSTLLMLSVIGMLAPTVLSSAFEETFNAEIKLSRGMSVLLFITYFAYLYFQIYTHPELFEEGGDEDSNTKLLDSAAGETTDSESQSQGLQTARDSNNSAAMPGSAKSSQLEIEKDGAAQEEDEEEDILGFNYAMVWLGIITVFIALLSDALATTIEQAAVNLNISSVFLSTIVLPIVGNAAEHASAVIFAIRDNLDLSLGVAVGSSTQIALMVLPLLVLIGWCMNKEMSLNFGEYEATTVFLTVVTVTFALKDGNSNWLMGFLLIMAYLAVSAGFLAQTDETLNR